MIYSWKHRYKAIEELLQIYPNLHISTDDNDSVSIKGIIYVNRKSTDFSLCKEYKIKIILYKDNNTLPKAYDLGNQVDLSYEHRYKDGLLCLDTDTAIKLRYENGLDLCSWMQNYVEGFYFSYEYFMRNGEYPFGERKHGSSGIIQTYSEYLHSDESETLNIIKYISLQGYNGHDLCPCGSNKYVRKCHGKYILPFFNNKNKLEMLINDYKYIMKEVYSNKQAR